MPRRVFITVGETSGDLHAASFVRELRKLEPDVIVDGLGGPAMRAAGVNVHHDTVSRATMGLRALLKAFEVRRLLKWTEDFCRRNPADLHVCIDSWTMNCYFARLAKRLGKPVLYYVAPQAWASRPGRARRMRSCIDQLACIFPFEQEWFSSRGVKTTFVGHPLFDHAKLGERTPHDGVIVGLLPGSRRGVARMNFPRLLEVAKMILREIPTVRFSIPTTASTDQVVRDEMARKNLSDGFVVKQNGFDELVPDCDLAITVSGTATLHVAAHNVPMIVVYYGSWLAWNLLGRWLINARTFAMVNILSPAGKHVAPEFIPWNGSVEPVARCAIDYVRHPEKLAEQRRKLAEILAPLAHSGASRKVAELAISMMK